MFYSKSTGGFYTTEIHGSNVPDDVVEITVDEHAALLEGQSQGKVISSDSNGFPILIAPAKATVDQVWKAIKAERERRTENGGYKVSVGGVDKWFHSDRLSRNQQIGLVLAGENIPAGLMWKTMDGSYVAMTAELAAQVVSASTLSDVAIFSAAEAHNTAMESAIDPSAYVFLSDWPKIFGE